MIVLFWDLDGTLLSTGRAGMLAWAEACRQVTGHALDPQALAIDGLTDHQVAARILEHAGHPVREDAVHEMVAIYERQLPASLHERHGRVHDGVREALSHLRARRPDVHSMLLTGNTAAGARAKLEHYQLSEFFDGGAFSVDGGPRAGIAARALAEARTRFPDAGIEPGHVFVIGDTPHDITCAQAIGARTIAVASGVYGADDLRTRGAWHVLERIPAPAAFERLIDQAAAPATGP